MSYYIINNRDDEVSVGGRTIKSKDTIEMDRDEFATYGRFLSSYPGIEVKEKADAKNETIRAVQPSRGQDDKKVRARGDAEKVSGTE